MKIYVVFIAFSELPWFFPDPIEILQQKHDACVAHFSKSFLHFSMALSMIDDDLFLQTLICEEKK